MEIKLRAYQEEVVQTALRGENSIIWLPTGGGKTRAAVYVTKKHLENRANAKVAVLVNKVKLDNTARQFYLSHPIFNFFHVSITIYYCTCSQVHLVDQHFEKEFSPYLGKDYKIMAISGDSDEKDFFGRVVKKSDVVICTAQILENALNNMDEEKHVELTGTASFCMAPHIF